MTPTDMRPEDAGRGEPVAPHADWYRPLGVPMICPVCREPDDGDPLTPSACRCSPDDLAEWTHGPTPPDDATEDLTC